MNVFKILSIAVVLVLLTATAQAQLPGLDMPDSWDGTGWIFGPDNGCGVEWGSESMPNAKDPVIGPIVGFHFEVLSEDRHFFWGVGLPSGFDDDLDAATFTVTSGVGTPTIITTAPWAAGDMSDWVLFSPPVKSFTITWGDPELFFDPETPEGQTIFPVWWGVTPWDCDATVRMSPIAVPEPSVKDYADAQAPEA